MPQKKTVKRSGTARKVSTRSSQTQKNSSRFGESYTSLVLGIIAIIIVSVVFLSFNRHKTEQKETQDNKGQISATSTVNPAVTSPKGDTYTVAAGDNLWIIAEKVYNDGYAWTTIAKANNITNPGTLYAGTVLKTPKIEKSQTTTMISAAPTRAPTQQPQQNQTQPTDKITVQQYTVQHGDYLWEIAVRKYGDGYRWVDIAKANNLQNPSLIHSGNVLRLP